ncbi:MAG: hypothetical protein QOI56_841 [Actinomycetota bacterium]|nr:hypothetical protein [Actinomycetota bacterium]
MGPGVRAFVAVFLALFVACALLQVEAWPFSGWKLFSQLRTDETRGWLATAVEAEGVEAPIPFGSFPPGHRGELSVLKGFDDLSPDGRRRVCRAWAAELGRMGTDVVEIRIYATTRSARHPEDDRRRLRHVCARL